MDKFIGQLKEAEIQDSIPKGDYYTFLFSIITHIIIFLVASTSLLLHGANYHYHYHVLLL